MQKTLIVFPFISVPLMESKIQVTVQGFVANIEYHLTYVNTSLDHLQTSFVFPVDASSPVYKFEAFVNKKHIKAECQDKKNISKRNVKIKNISKRNVKIKKHIKVECQY